MDVIANMLIMLKNASRADKGTVTVPFSKQKEAIAKCLVREGYIATAEKKIRDGFPFLVLTLAGEARKINEVKRISKPSRRMYAGVKDFAAFSRRGLLVLSTPKGVLSAREARKELVGGEVLFSMW